jgi:hypothetical protein
VTGATGAAQHTGMNVKLLQLRRLALSAVALVAMSSAAWALDAGDFTTKLKGLVLDTPAGTSIAFELGAATVSGSDVTFAGLTLGSKASADETFKTTTPVTFSGVNQQADGSYVVDAMTLPDQDIKTDQGEVTIKGIKLSHLLIPNGKSPSVLDSTRFFAEGSVGPIVVTVDGVKVFTLDSASINNSFTPSQTDVTLAGITSTVVTSGMKFDLSGTKDADSLKQIKALDLVTVTGKLLDTLSWNTADGHLNLSEISTDLDKIGKLKFALDITGYTPAFLQSLSAVSQAYAASQSGGTDNTQAATAMLLGAAQSLFFNSTSVRFDDDSITNKLLDVAAKQAGVDRPALINQAVAMLPAILNEDQSSPVPVPVIQTVQAATRAYLNDPHSIEVRLAPKAPLGVLGIVAAVMAPATLAEQLGLKILVNDKEITAADAAKETGTPPAGAAAPADDSTTPPDNGNSSTAAPADGTDTTAPATDDSTAAPSDDSTAAPADDSTNADNSSGASGKEQKSH